MTHLQFKWAFLCIGLIGSAGLGGCIAQGSSQEVELVGTLKAALAATGSDGAVYRFPMGSSILIQSSTFAQPFLIDGSYSTPYVRLPVWAVSDDMVPSTQ